MVKANIRFFMKILTSVTPESVVERLVRIIIHIWLFRQNSLQRKVNLWQKRQEILNINWP